MATADYATDAWVVEEESIHTRRRARNIVESASDQGYSAIDISRVEFIGRSVADELIQGSIEHDLDLIKPTDEVEQMLDIVR